MCRYHTVFLSSAGLVYTCGHGRGGRLGHGSEPTCLVCMRLYNELYSHRSLYVIILYCTCIKLHTGCTKIIYSHVKIVMYKCKPQKFCCVGEFTIER